MLINFNKESGDVIGVIINKTDESGDFWIGGPYEFEQQFILHNVPDVKGAKKIVEGVWLGGEI